jgi:hypothetical protein
LKPTDCKTAAAGVAALSLRESLLIALLDLQIMSGKRSCAVQEVASPSNDGAVHRGAGELVAALGASLKAVA